MLVRTILLTILFFAINTWLFAQGVNQNPAIVIPQKQALLVDYLNEGAGASHIFGFFFLDIDTDKDGTPDFFQTGPGDDLDGDGLTNAADPDDDNDGIPDALDVEPIGVTSTPAHLFRNGTVAEANGTTISDYWQFVPNNLISGGPFDGYFEHPGAYLYIDNNANAVPDILEYVTGDNQMPPYTVDKGFATAHALLGPYLGLLGSWEYSGSPGSTAAERSHLTGSTIFYICDDDSGTIQSGLYHPNSPYGTTYSDIYGNSNGQVDYNIYGTTSPNSTLIPQEILGMDPQGVDFFRYRWFEHIVDANREVVYFAAVFWGSGGSQSNTYYSRPAFNPEIVQSYSIQVNGSTTGDNYGGSGIENWFPRFQHTADHDRLAEAVFGPEITWAMIATAPTDGSSPVAVNPADQAWVDQYENWTTNTQIIQYLDVTEWFNNASINTYDLINGRYGVDLSNENQDIIVRMEQRKLPHMAVYSPSSDPNSLVIGLEDLFGLGDRDFEDVVFYITDFKDTKITAFKTDQFTLGQCQDTIQYKVVIRNSGDPNADDIVFNDSPDPNTALVVGSVTTTQGTVSLGNTAGNTAVQVDVGSLAEGDSVVIHFTVDANNGIYPAVTTIANQGVVSGNNFSDVNTSDPNQELHFQPTITNLADIIDQTPPSISCPASFSVNTDPGACNAIVSYMPPLGTDNCPETSTSLLEGLASGATFMVGSNTITYMVTDAMGNSSNCSFTITVNDNEAPTANCAADFSLILNAAGNASLTANDINNSSDDACGIASTNISLSSFGCSDVGPNTITLTVEDNNGNTNTCSTIVTIQDNTPPTANCQNVSVQLDGNGSGSTTASAINNASDDACGIASLNINQENFTCTDLGANLVVLTVYDQNGNSNTCSATATVEDMEDPTADCTDLTINLVDRNIYTLAQADIDEIAVNATDNCPNFTYAITNGTTSYDCDDRGSDFVLTLTVTDGSSNTSSCTALLTIADPNSVCNDPPEAVCKDITISADNNCEASIVAQDVDGGSSDPDGDPLNFEVDNEGPFAPGNHVVTLSVSDAEFTATCTATITVEDTSPPIADCQDVTLELDQQNGQGTLSENEVNNGSMDNCGITTIAISQSAFDCTDLGEQTLTLTVSDLAGNTQTCTSTLRVEGLPCGWTVDPDGIDCSDAEATYDLDTDVFSLTSEGCYDPNFYRATDNQGFMQQELCGNGEIIAQVTAVDGSGWAGISMRESNNPDAKMIQLMIDGVSLSRRELRQTTGGYAFAHVFQTNGKNWLRLTRSGNQFIAAHSLDGVNWEYVFITQMAMTNCIEIGLTTMNSNPAGTVTGTFQNVSVTGGSAPLAVPSTLDFDLDQAQQVDFYIFPNPASNQATVRLDQFMDKALELKLYDIFGKVLLQQQFTAVQSANHQLSLEGLPSGTYLVEVRSGNQRIMKKLIVEKR